MAEEESKLCEDDTTTKESSELYTVRRAEFSDSEGVTQLIDARVNDIFGRINAEDIIEKANLSITLANENNKLLSFAAFYDHPGGKHDWVEWMHSAYDSSNINPLSALFLRLFVSQEGFSQGALKEILHTSFQAMPLLQHVVLCLPSPNIDIGPALNLYFSPVPSLDDQPSLLFISHRHQHYPMLHVRLAKVEDNDDLLPIIQHHSSNQLTDQYGDYFIAELIESVDEDHQTIVAEVNGRAVGFISVTTDINLDILWDNYQLEPYHGLRKPSPDDIITIDIPGSHKTSTVSMQSNNKSMEKTSISSVPHSATSSVVQTDDDNRPPTDEKSVASSSGQASLASMSTVDGSFKTALPQRKYVLNGPSNAVAVQLFCMDDQYEMRSIDLLPIVFQLFQNVDFIALTLPHFYPHYPLLSHFTRISPREGKIVSQELYILHKCSLIHTLQVRLLKSDDVPMIEDLVQSLSAERLILEDVNNYVIAERDPLSKGATPIYAFVVELLQQIVGIVILRQEENVMYLRSHYNIEDYVLFDRHLPEEHMHLHHFLINPILAPHIKHILKESMRLSHCNNLYYPLPIGKHLTTNHSLTMALHEMIPIKWRQQVAYPDGLGPNASIKDVTAIKPHATLYHTNRKLSMEPKIPINTRIVCVGASDTILSFLEQLIFSPHLTFNNLILLSPNGLAVPSANVLPDSCCFLDNNLATIGLEAWLTVIPGTLTSIERNTQTITVKSTGSNEDTFVCYDYLVLGTGVQYVIETPNKGLIPSHGLITLNNGNCNEMIEKALQLIEGNNKGNVVIYGSHLISYTLIEHLIQECNISGDRITLVQIEGQPSCFANDVVQKKVLNSLTSSGVTMLSAASIHQYIIDPSGQYLNAVELIQDDDSKHTTIPCKIMYCLQTKRVNNQSFKAINDACLVYDNRLVIDPQHATNDPLILGAGPLTKFSRYYRTPWSHEHFNSRQVGTRLADSLLSKLDPTYYGNINGATNSDLIPDYDRPKEIYARLPGNQYYLHIDKPQVVPRKKFDNGNVLSTTTENGYFQLYLNQYSRIETITVLSDKMFEVSNYRCLYNMHEQYLNNLLTRWENKLITDLFLYFREQWTCVIFHDRFPYFLSEINDLLISTNEQNTSLKTEVQNILDDSIIFSVENNKKKIATLFGASGLTSTINKRLHNYLLYNSYHLPMYAQPDMM